MTDSLLDSQKLLFIHANCQLYVLHRAGRVTEVGDIGQRFQPKEHLVLVLG